MILDNVARQAWASFLNNADNLGHAERVLSAPDIDAHVQACWHSATVTALRIQQDLSGLEPKHILEVGASAGFNCFALQQQYPKAEVIGIEPEEAAVCVANAMATTYTNPVPRFLLGLGESLPIPSSTVDLIVCHTVIEHVQNVEQVISEMARVLSPSGVIHLEAPNYVWPYEPHLGIWCIPLLGKTSVRGLARLQGKSKRLGFLGHLQFVTPPRLEAAFRRNGMVWENRVKAKLERALGGDATQIKAYKRLTGILRLLAKAGLSKLLVGFVMRTHLYPSVLYTIRKGRRA